MKDRKLDVITNQMAAYYGTITKAAFIAEMLDPTYDPSSDFFQPPNPDPASIAANALLDLTEGGEIIAGFLKKVEENLKEKPDDDQHNAEVRSGKKTVAETFCVTFEPGVVDDKENHHINGNKTVGYVQGYGKKGGMPTAEEQPYSIKRMLGISGEGEGVTVNGKPEDPDRAISPNLSVTQIFPVAFGPGTQDTSALSLFLNAVPSLEFSRCIPFIDVVAITNSPPLSHTNSIEGGGRISTIGLAQFLMGADKVQFADASGIMANSVDADVFTEFLKKPPKKKVGDDDPSNGEDLPPPNVPEISTAGMEMFTSPQTLVNADEVHYEADSEAFRRTNVLTGDDEDSTTLPGGKRAAPIIDRFRPFLSLENISFNVAPGGGMFAFKTANLKMTLHDRSRLAELQPFIKPDAFGNSHLLLEYGWAHPEYKVHDTLADRSKYLIGHFLGSLRCREKYRVVNTSYSFDDVGQVSIDIKLSMLGANAIHQVKIGMGGKVADSMKVMEKLTKAIAEILKKNGGSGMSADAGGEDFLTAASSTSGAMSMSKETMEKVTKFISRNKGAKAGSPMAELSGKLTELYGKNGKGGAVKNIQDTVSNEIKRKLSLMTKTEDPWFLPIQTKDSAIAPKKFVSLCKLIVTFLGLPIAATKEYDDIQFLFYSINDKGSYLAGRNLASFPIDVADFELMFKEETKNNPNLSMNKFMSFINGNFLADQGNPAYGMTKIYGERDKEDLKKRKVNSKFKDASPAEIAMAQQEVLKHAYQQGDASDLEFKMPSIKMMIECVPGKNPTADDGSSSGEAPKAKNILRIHLYDRQATKYSAIGKMLQAMQGNATGQLTGLAGKIKHGNVGLASKSPEELAKIKKEEIDGKKSPSGSGKPMTTEEYDDILTDKAHQEFASLIKKALDSNMLETIPKEAGEDLQGPKGEIRVEEFAKVRFRIKGGFPALKNFVASNMPSVRYGALNSGIITANLQSMQNPQLATINMLRAGQKGSTDPQGHRDAGVPLRVAPMELNIETMGCPLWRFGQQVFIDFGTGTTADNVYSVTGIDHSIASGEFKSSVKMVQLNTFGKFTAMTDRVEEALNVIKEEGTPEDKGNE